MHIPSPSHLYIGTEAADFRKSFDGLSGLVRGSFGRDPSDGSLYVFFNKRRDQVKVLYYLRGGMCLWRKRLEQGSFAPLTAPPGSSYVLLTPTEVQMLIDGIAISSEKKRLRYQK